MHRLLLLVFVAVVLAVVLAGCGKTDRPRPGPSYPPPDDYPVPTLPPGPGGLESIVLEAEHPIKYPQPGCFVVTGHAQWCKLFGVTLPSPGGPVYYANDPGFRAPDSDVPRVDFTRSLVLAVSLGIKRTGGYSVRITRVGRIPGQGIIVARAEIVEPGPGGIVAEVVTMPGHAVVIPRTPGRVQFQKIVNGQSSTEPPFVAGGGGEPGTAPSEPPPLPTGTPPQSPPPPGGGEGDLNFDLGGTGR
ncbi:MAG: protease complex subunit PrcB family protein [Candidatus Riflebacteria bacterium]|nr:protease complex subunit PrcB family protein [Candidatus Riflebacteria bacterium]